MKSHLATWIIVIVIIWCQAEPVSSEEQEKDGKEPPVQKGVSGNKGGQQAQKVITTADNNTGTKVQQPKAPDGQQAKNGKAQQATSGGQKVNTDKKEQQATADGQKAKNGDSDTKPQPKAQKANVAQAGKQAAADKNTGAKAQQPKAPDGQQAKNAKAQQATSGGQKVNTDKGAQQATADGQKAKNGDTDKKVQPKAQKANVAQTGKQAAAAGKDVKHLKAGEMEDAMRKSEDMKKHLGQAADIDFDRMTQKEVTFHFFQLHDFDGNKMLDGLEIIKGLAHVFHETIQFDYHYIVDQMLTDGDKDNDGYLTYAEYSASDIFAKGHL